MAPSQIFEDSEEIDDVVTAEEFVAGAATDGDNPLTIAVPKQEKEEWCWAAVCVGLRKFYDNEEIRQCAIATEVIGGDCCTNGDMCNEPQFLSIVLDDMHYREAKKDQVTFDLIRAQIDKGRPLCCFIDHGSDVGHFIVISGYDADSKQIGVLDPAPGEAHISPRMVPFSAFRISYNDGTWMETYLTHPRT
jgi:hypothetical protein